MTDDDDRNWNVISVYTRQQAINDGLFTDITELARECGLLVPTVMTHSVAECFGVEVELRAILWAFATKIAGGAAEENELCALAVIDRVGVERTLWLHLGPGDGGEPVLTLMFPEDW